jgi:hypothetical protein
MVELTTLVAHESIGLRSWIGLLDWLKIAKCLNSSVIRLT